MGAYKIYLTESIVIRWGERRSHLSTIVME